MIEVVLAWCCGDNSVCWRWRLAGSDICCSFLEGDVVVVGELADREEVVFCSGEGDGFRYA